jgi:hypothetical protein
VTAVAFSPNNQLLFSGDFEGKLAVWNARDGQLIFTVHQRRKTGPVQTIIALNDDQILVGWRYGLVEIFDAKLDKQKSQPTDGILGGHDGLNAIAFTPDRHIVIAHQSGTLSIWMPGMEDLLQTLQASATPFIDIAVTPDGHKVVALSLDETLHIWELTSTPQFLSRINSRIKGLHKFSIMPDGVRAILGSADGQLAMWNLESGAELFKLAGHKHPLSAMALIDDGRQLVTTSDGGKIRAWDLETRDQVISHRGDRLGYAALAVAPDGHTLATGSSDKIVRLWDRVSLIPSPRAAPAPRRYSLLIASSAETIAAGQRFNLRVSLVAVESGKEVFELPAHVTSLVCFFSSDDQGLRINGSEAAYIRVDQETEEFMPISFELQARWPGPRSYSLQLFAEDPTSGKVRIYETSRKIGIKAPVAGEIRMPLLPSVEVRVAPQPDFVLQIDTDLPEDKDGPRALTYRLSSRLPNLGMRNQEVGRANLPAGELSRIRTLLLQALQPAGDLQPEDRRERLLSFGTYLFDRLFPADQAAAFREIFWQAAEHLTTWLFVEDGVTWIPWELLVPYRTEALLDPTLPRYGTDRVQERLMTLESKPRPDREAPLYFLGERFQLGRWLELGPALYGEVPLGDLALAHYKVPAPDKKDDELTAWAKLLGAAGAGGIAEIVKQDRPCYRLHLLRYADEPGGARRELVARENKTEIASPAEDAKRARLDLRLNRPVISLSILDGSGTHKELMEDWPLPDRILPFLRAGASAVIGPWWPTSEVADRTFWLNFYDLLEARLPLGEAVWRARRMVKRALPHSSDWLAYTMFGDPRARAYTPEPSEGYTTLERLYSDQPLYPGQACYFRASISSRPSLLYRDRLVQAEDLPKHPMALFLAPGLQNEIPEPVEMKLVGSSTVEAIYKLTPEKAGKFALIARIYDGDERLQSLQLPFLVEKG